MGFTWWLRPKQSTLSATVSAERQYLYFGTSKESKMSTRVPEYQVKVSTWDGFGGEDDHSYEACKRRLRGV
jgi:hypothetical protein